MKRANAFRRPPSGHGFTLVELLVVIGIIAVLLGILLPVINAVRRAAYATDSRNSLRNLTNAIDRYYTDFTAYPGLFSNADVSGTINYSILPAPTSPLPGSNRLTCSESMVWSMMGGENGGTYYPAELGRGAITHGTVARRISAYIDSNPKAMSVPGSSLDPSGIFGYNTTYDKGQNAGVPEFIDAYPAALPIVYLRARPGATGSIDQGTNLTQYNVNLCLPYFDPTTISVTDFPAATPFAAGMQTYFGNAALSTAALPVPKNKDTYMLISAGPDRKYGTADDICNFSF